MRTLTSVLLAAVVAVASLLPQAPAQAAVRVTPNSPYTAGLNAIVVEGMGTATEATASIEASSGLQVTALWAFRGTWLFYLPDLPAIEGGLSTFTANVTAAFAVLSSGAPAATTPGDSATVAEVVDGDTIRVMLNGAEATVRLILIDTPEVFGGAECYGAEASAYAKSLLPIGTAVTLETDVSETDRFGRLLRYVYAGGEMVNERLVRDGYAVLATFPPDVKYKAEIQAAEQEARAANRGLWAACSGDDTPVGGTPAPTATASPLPTTTAQPSTCDPAYPAVCIPSPPPDLDCGDITHRRFTVLAPDPHRFDVDGDGIGCES